MAVSSFPIKKIIVPEGRRELNDVESLMQSIKETGLLQPIVVSPEGRLVAGHHRLEACRQLGWQEIAALILEQDDVRIQMAEIDENLVRHELKQSERSELLVRRRDLYHKLHPEAQRTESGSGQKKGKSEKKSISKVPSFADDTSRKTKQTKRNVEMDLQIGDRIPAGVMKKVKKTPLDKKTNLLKIARLPDEQTMHEVVDVALERNFRKVDDAIIRVQSAAQKLFEKIAPRLTSGDVMEMLAELPDESAELFIIGPLKDCPSREMITALSAEIRRLLKMDGSLVVLAHQSTIPDLLAAFGPYFQYRMIVACLGLTGSKPSGTGRWLPALWFAKDEANELDVPDLIGSTRVARGNGSPWEHHQDARILDLLEIFTKPSDMVINPYCESMPRLGVMAMINGRQFTGISENVEILKKIQDDASLLITMEKPSNTGGPPEDESQDTSPLPEQQSPATSEG